ncbi:hypothetical protein [Saliphagus sp. LR7]|uniref:hypothetical protein n=1 Tax=Saliphagus sp. LR7 TaxID=2282654 RepID=UPI001300922E|nr:hypothetical protein [Saliphagus sp. LR7]
MSRIDLDNDVRTEFASLPRLGLLLLIQDVILEQIASDYPLVATKSPAVELLTVLVRDFIDISIKRCDKEIEHIIHLAANRERQILNHVVDSRLGLSLSVTTIDANERDIPSVLHLGEPVRENSLDTVNRLDRRLKVIFRVPPTQDERPQAGPSPVDPRRRLVIRAIRNRHPDHRQRDPDGCCHPEKPRATRER